MALRTGEPGPPISSVLGVSRLPGRAQGKLRVLSAVHPSLGNVSGAASAALHTSTDVGGEEVVTYFAGEAAHARSVV